MRASKKMLMLAMSFALSFLMAPSHSFATSSDDMFEVLKNNTTFEQWHQVWKRAPSGSEVRRLALEKMSEQARVK